MFRLILLAASLLMGLLIACDSSSKQEKAPDPTSRLVEFQGRKIDLHPYFEGFPYSAFRPFYAADKLFYYENGATTRLMQTGLQAANLEAGTAVSDLDFAQRNVWNTRYRRADSSLYWSGDERNDEVINLYRLDLKTQQLHQLTDVPYMFGWRWNEAQDKVAYVARLGNKEERLGELRVLDLNTGKDSLIAQDRAGMRFTWGDPVWQPEGKGLLLNALRDADRTYGNLVYVDLESGQQTVLTNPSQPRQFPVAHEEWLDPYTFLFVSNEDGYRNLYRYNFLRLSQVQLTYFEKDLANVSLLEVDGQKRLFATLSSPLETELLLLDALSGEVLKREPVATEVSVLDDEENRLLVQVGSTEVRFRIDEMTVSPEGFFSRQVVDLPEGLEEKIVHAKVERVSFPTFDTDPATGKARMLHGYLYVPENPLPDSQALAMIQSFYGGENAFSTRTQILAEAGIYVFSPSPRGSSGFGREFAALNDKDLGGNEILDIIYAGKYLAERLDLAPERIGVYGGSHGGYATMRLLTFPGEINGHEAAFDWGFGLSHAGFSDIIEFYEYCNIPDWVTLEAGDPEEEADKLRDRSPLYHADEMTGKLLLTHGTNDSRVPISGSRRMADSLQAYGKDVRLVTFEGQGHGIKGLENQVVFYRHWFDFLAEVAAQ